MRRRFDLVRDGLHGVLPAPVRRLVPVTAVGYVLLNGFTFSVDIALLTLGFHVLHLPYPLAVSIGYVTAFALGYVLNRALNFDSHGAVGGELVRYALVVAVNYGAFVVAGSWALVHLGVQYQLARITAACAETVFMYCALRWLVFRRPEPTLTPRRATTDGVAPAARPR